ncbi:MAG: hypothetical protein HWE16_06890 [Gammaproteobacteria bacterium]|nr:hypothetical protein [Gammaproteobacteria bacterium]
MSPEDNPEILIKQYIRPVTDDAGRITFKGKGQKTVDVQSIKERFKSLDIVVNWSRFDEMNSLRNELEHYYSSASPGTVKEIISNSFILIRDFLTEHLNLDPQDLLGNEAWAVLLEINEIYTSEALKCSESLENIDWEFNTVKDSLKHLRCNKCHSSLVNAPSEGDEYPNISLNCKSCNHEFLFTEVVEQCIDELLAGKAHVAIKDGGESPYDECPECRQNTYIHAEEICVACEYTLEYTHCNLCEVPLGIDEQFNEGYCGYCEYKLGKVMAE